MRKIMWLCNTPLPDIREELGVKICGEGWLQGISNQLRKQEGIELHYVFPQNNTTRLFKMKKANIFFWGFYSEAGNGYDFCRQREKCISWIIREIKPDIIHIFGTEFAHSLECIREVPDDVKAIVSIQGLVSKLEKVYTKKISIKDRIIRSEYSASLVQRKYEFYRRGINEIEILKKASNVIGRTAWDKQCIKQINPNCRYFYCNETLRESFYEGKWDINQVRKHSIYISQAHYPIKGFHIFLKALGMLIQDFPDIHVYVGGNRIFLKSEDAYGKYIKKLMRKYKVESNIEFLGTLSAEEVKQRLLSVHVMVMPSLLENSPNSIGEAMLLGTPIVAARVGGIPSLVRDKKEAMLYSDYSAKKMADCIKSIFMSKALTRKLSDNELRRGKKLYDRRANLDELLKIYEIVEGKEHEKGNDFSIIGSDRCGSWSMCHREKKQGKNRKSESVVR